MKKLFASILPSAVAVLLAAILAHFVYHFPPDILGALRSLPDQFHADWNFPVHGAMGLLTVLVMWFGAAGIGRLILFGTGAARSLPSFWARWVFATLVGWIGLSLSIFIFGMAGWFSRTALGGLMIAISAIGLKGWSSLPAELRGHLGIAEEELEGLANGTDDESSAREKPLPGPDLEQSGMGTWRTFLVLALYAVT
ncbi:hypothetical protein HYR69_05760, partial [Candidatus Sumerlaeota bacterium]|nr:hypothetical protein [Candidatus Sumerlaeota bacterium]